MYRAMDKPARYRLPENLEALHPHPGRRLDGEHPPYAGSLTCSSPPAASNPHRKVTRLRSGSTVAGSRSPRDS